jgi:hypothetical protein
LLNPARGSYEVLGGAHYCLAHAIMVTEEQAAEARREAEQKHQRSSPLPTPAAAPTKPKGGGVTHWKINWQKKEWSAV